MTPLLRAKPVEGAARALTAGLLLLGLTLAACSSAEGGDDQNRLRELTVGVLPIADVAPLYLGIDKGFFRDEGLEIEVQVVEGGSVLIPSLMSGDMQFGFSNVVSVIIASNNGLPLRIVSTGSKAGIDDAKLLALSSSSIRRPADLAGKTIAVNLLNNIATVTTLATLDQVGVDTSDIDFIEIPFPEMLPALEDGDVDAVFEREPFITLAEEAGAREIINPYSSLASDLNVGVYVATEDYIDANPSVVESFVQALERSLDYAQAHPDEVRQTIAEHTEMPPELAGRIDLPNWSSNLNESHIELLGDLARRFGLIDSEPQLDVLIMDPAS